MLNQNESPNQGGTNPTEHGLTKAEWAALAFGTAALAYVLWIAIVK